MVRTRSAPAPRDKIRQACNCPDGEVYFLNGGTQTNAVVIPQPGRIPHFFTTIKQHGALLAKGWLLGVQFDVLFSDGLYSRIGAPAIDKCQSYLPGPAGRWL